MSPAAETRILFVGDMHLGRSPGRVPPSVDARALGPDAALAAACALAEELGVQAVAFAGDLVDGQNAAFEAYGLLEQGIRRLVGAGIEVYAVAGNHDTATLPRLAAVLADGFHLLGRGGTWSTGDVASPGGPTVRLAGWSFPARHHDGPPPLAAAPPPRPGLATFGLLHCDLDASDSRYAPVPARDLKAVGYQAWFLGHVHKPSPVPSDGAPFYLGSVTGLDPGETGAHGPVLATVAGDGAVRLQRIPLGPLRWERLELPCPDPDRLVTSLLEGVVARARALGPETDRLSAIGFRIELTGRVASPAAVQRAVAGLQPAGLITETAGVRLFIEKVTSAVTGQVDLPALSLQNDPLGLLARQILALEDPAGGDGEASRLAADLLRDAAEVVRQVGGHSHFRLIGTGSAPLDEDALRDLLIRTGRLALDGLIQDKGGPDAPA